MAAQSRRSTTWGGGATVDTGQFGRGVLGGRWVASRAFSARRCMRLSAAFGLCMTLLACLFGWQVRAAYFRSAGQRGAGGVGHKARAQQRGGGGAGHKAYCQGRRGWPGQGALGARRRRPLACSSARALAGGRGFFSEPGICPAFSCRIDCACDALSVSGQCPLPRGLGAS